MEKGKWIPLVVTAFFVIVISIFSFSLVKANPQETEAENVTTDSSVKGEKGDSNVTNHVENNINGGKADVQNSITNNIKNGTDNQVDNQISNNIEVNVDVNVSNEVDNQIDGNSSGANELGNKDTTESNGTSGTKENGTANEKEKGTSNEKIIWGVDSASLTTSEMLSCVRENFGEPAIWGRYLGEKEGVSTGITKEEIELLHSNEIQILPIWNHFTDATGYENGKNEAKAAIQLAEEMGIPDGVAIFADIEPDYPVDSEFVKGWFEVMNDSPYEAGIYGIFDPDRELTVAFNQAAENVEGLLDNTYLWTAAPNIGITTQTNAPAYQPEAPENALLAGWQYGIDAEACNIDTNLFEGSLTDVLW